MKLLIVALLVASASSLQTHSRKESLMYRMKIWVTNAAHCAEYATEDGELDESKADECRRCFAGVGNWAVPENNAKGMECLATYEPMFAEMCGEKMQAYNEDQTNENEIAVDECWEECNLRRIAEKCVAATGDAGKDMEMLCVMKHLSDNVRYARDRVFGDKHDPWLAPTEDDQEVEYIFEEGRCEQAAAGDEDFKAECNMCFKHVQKMSANLKNAAGEYDQNKILPAASMWVACADNFWSPAYAECFEGVEDMMNHIKEWNTEEYHARQLEMQACFMLKQSQYWFAECKEGAGDGVDGLVNFVHCARNTTAVWVGEKRPEALDLAKAWMQGGSKMPDRENMM